MEAQNKSNNNNGGEVRRLHIVYFLSRNGRIEHPHLIRLNHLSTNGVRLRDVKRWLGELRGKDMAESFAWSYKRKYKTGYLWQDLFDDDLITPISDNEYVLKGSEISSTATTGKDKSNPMQKDHSEAAAKNSNKESSDQTSIYTSTKSSPLNSFEEEEEHSPIFTSSTLTNDDHSGDIDRTIVNNKTPSCTSDAASQKMKREAKNSLDSPYVLVSDKTIINKKKDVKASNKTASSKPQTNNGSSKSMLRNLITCGRAVETNDSALVVMKKQPDNQHSGDAYRPLLNMCSGDVRNVHSAEVYGRREKKSAGGSDILLQNTNLYRSQSTTARMRCNENDDSAKRNCEGRDISASYKPINGPVCSLCNKQFKPEKLHAHMISCKGRRKTMFKGTSTNLSHESSTQIPMKEDFGSRYLLVDRK